MVPAGDKAKRLSSVNHTTKTMSHHHQLISISIVRIVDSYVDMCYIIYVLTSVFLTLTLRYDH